jgi:glycerol-3-phosphate dehydrogenase
MIDSRMDLLTLFTSSIDQYHEGFEGSTIANYVEFKEFIKDNGKIVGVIAFDRIANKEIKIRSKVVVNTIGVVGD